MDGIEQHSLTGSNGTYSVWIGNGQEMKKICESHKFLLITQESDNEKGELELILSSSSDNNIVQILAALHDHCARNGKILPRTWKIPGEKQKSESIPDSFSGFESKNKE